MAHEFDRYNKVAIILHWLMALAFIMMLLSGVGMKYFKMDPLLKFNLYQWHKSGGVLLLLAFFLRLGWRFCSVAPPLPKTFPKLEKMAAHIGHLALYVFMIALPLSGWIMVSSSAYGLPTIVFNLFEWPHIQTLFPFLLDIQANEALNEQAKTAHFVLAILFALTIFVHIAAVLKHIWIDKEPILKRMTWKKKG